MVYVTLANGITVWENTTQILQNITNSTSPIAAVNAAVNAALPWWWPILPFFLYLYLMVAFADAQGPGKLYMIAALVLVISVFMSFGGYLIDAVINLFIFLFSFWLARQFKYV